MGLVSSICMYVCMYVGWASHLELWFCVDLIWRLDLKQTHLGMLYSPICTCIFCFVGGCCFANNLCYAIIGVLHNHHACCSFAHAFLFCGSCCFANNLCYAIMEYYTIIMPAHLHMRFCFVEVVALPTICVTP